jgi:hypothetical protein
VLGAVALAAYTGWIRLGPRAERRPAPPAPASAAPAAAAPRGLGIAVSQRPAPPAPAVPAASPASEPDQDEEPAHPEDQEAELPPVPRDLSPEKVTIYGVVYDLATKKPVPRARIDFGSTMWGRRTYTDAHGWYRLDFQRNAVGSQLSVGVVNFRHRPGALQEQDPPLASYSDGERHTIAEESDDPLPRLEIPLNHGVDLAELDMALIPREWPRGMAPAVFADAVDPPVPDEPDVRICRYYGIVYDLATRKPLRRLALDFQNAPTADRVFTDALGRYTIDVPVMALPLSPMVTGNAPNYRPGLTPERDPPMRLMSEKVRRGIADVIDLSFDPSPLPTDCDDGIVRYDLAAVPLRWPAPP